MPTDRSGRSLIGRKSCCKFVSHSAGEHLLEWIVEGGVTLQEASQQERGHCDVCKCVKTLFCTWDAAICVLHILMNLSIQASIWEMWRNVCLMLTIKIIHTGLTDAHRCHLVHSGYDVIRPVKILSAELLLYLGWRGNSLWEPNQESGLHFFRQCWLSVFNVS